MITFSYIGSQKSQSTLLLRTALVQEEDGRWPTYSTRGFVALKRSLEQAEQRSRQQPPAALCWHSAAKA